ncbi:hypothetical protein [Paenibacillus sp. 1P07SE]|uniref:hypothetical protein n=1 Tax=Paenibacillus sp. 1P07SE TaxID=3132209 RepID=UPI0039A42866
MIQTSFRVNGPLTAPFYSEWGKLSYVREEAFDLDPFTLPAAATSGSPVLFSDELFVGFLDESGGRFIYDGRETLTVVHPAEQRLFVREHMDPFAAWAQYNAEAVKRLGLQQQTPTELHRALEYCTWVEQKAAARSKAEYSSVLSEAFVDGYMERLERLGLPKGKLTIDDGWYTRHSEGGSGTIEPNERFPDLAALARRIEGAGYQPGIWLDLGCVSPLSAYYQRHGDQVKPHTYWGDTETNAERRFLQAVPGETLRRQFHEIFSRLIDAGYVKFKIDMLYGFKHEMKAIMALAYETAHGIHDAIEIEAHIPDLFVSRYCDVVRTNDVLIREGTPWMQQTKAYWSVCYHSSPCRWLNLDHIGGNDPQVSEADFAQHLQLFRRVPGYPVLSLLPDRFSEQTQRLVRDLLNEYNEHKMDASHFSSIPSLIRL